MLSLRERLAVVNLYEELGSYRAVAALVGCDHKTVKAWLEREKTGAAAPKPRPKATDPYLPLIQAKVAATQGKIKSRPLLRIVRAAGYTASTRTLERALREVRQEWARERASADLSAMGECARRVPDRRLGRGQDRADPSRRAEAAVFLCRPGLEPLEVRAVLHGSALPRAGSRAGWLFRDAERRAGQRAVR
jgi:transposase